MSKIVIDIKENLLKHYSKAIIVDSLIMIVFVICGLVGFIFTSQGRLFIKSIMVGFLFLVVKEMKFYIDYSTNLAMRKKLTNVAASAGLLTYRNLNNPSLVLGTREIVAGPIFKVYQDAIGPLNLEIQVFPDGCPNADKIYHLQQRLQEEFGRTAELKSKFGHATYYLRYEPKHGKKLSNEDFS